LSAVLPHNDCLHERLKHCSSGTQTLAPGETKQVWIGPTFRPITVRNDATSKGTVTVTSDARGSDVLAWPPGAAAKAWLADRKVRAPAGGLPLPVARSQAAERYGRGGHSRRLRSASS
jgi:hypothetical protein